MRRAASLVLCVLGSLSVVRCTPVLQGEPLDLGVEATPPLAAAAKPHLPTAPPSMIPSAMGGGFRAWVPRQVAPNGDVVEGHWLEVSEQAPAAEVLPPSVHIPRAPTQAPRVRQGQGGKKVVPPPAMAAPSGGGMESPGPRANTRPALPTPGFAFPVPGGTYAPTP